MPAEEFIEVEQRLELRTQKKLEFLGGKQELIRLGRFDDVDIAMMCHTASDMGERKFAIGGTSNGHVVKYVRYTGVGAHAGQLPLTWASNALNAASCLRVASHQCQPGDPPRGGQPCASTASSPRAGEGRERRPRRRQAGVARSLLHFPRWWSRIRTWLTGASSPGALAVGAQVEITTIPGYLPMRNDTRLQDLFRNNAVEMIGEKATMVMPASRNRGGSTDMGDLSHLIPAIHPYTGGATGPGHSKSYVITDYETAVINPAKIMAMVVIDLLTDGAKTGQRGQVGPQGGHVPL